MLFRTVSYCRAKPFKVSAAAPRPRKKGRFRVAISDRPLYLSRMRAFALSRSRIRIILFHLSISIFFLSIYVSLQIQVPNKLDIFDDDIMLRAGAWDQITLWSGGTGFNRRLCDAVLAETCTILAKHEALLHPDGEVKFSHMVGGSTVTPHCGPQDTKIRMHYMVVRWLWLGFRFC